MTQQCHDRQTKGPGMQSAAFADPFDPQMRLRTRVLNQMVFKFAGAPSKMPIRQF
jgi:hypothetical protein